MYVYKHSIIHPSKKERDERDFVGWMNGSKKKSVEKKTDSISYKCIDHGIEAQQPVAQPALP